MTPRARFLLAVALAPLLLASCAGLQEASPSQMAEVETVEQHGLTKAEAFARLQRWAAESYGSANEVVQLADEEAGALVLKGAERVVHNPGGVLVTVGYTMTIDVKDDRVRFQQRISGRPDGGYVSQHAADQVLDLFPSLRASAMAALETDDDW